MRYIQANIGGTSYGAEKLPFVIDGVWENVKNIPLHGFVKYFIISIINKIKHSTLMSCTCKM
jgi:hypothetical protein